MTDRDFELLLEEEMTALPPGDELVTEITPWRNAMNRILIGLGLATIEVNFLMLNAFLPMIGNVMMLLGFRTLRRENRWFTLGYWMTILRTLYFLVWQFLKATIFYETASGSPVAEQITYMMLAVVFLQLLSLGQGIRCVRRKAASDAYAGGTTALLIMYCIMVVLGFIEYSGFGGWLILIIYVVILRALWELSKALDEAGYTIAAAPVRVSDDSIKTAYTLVIIASLLAGLLFFSRYPMDWQEVEIPAESDTKLEALDFPDYVLADLTEAEIEACLGAKAVYVETEEIAFNDGVQITESDGYSFYTHTEYPVKELLITHVAVRPAKDTDPWIVIHHFLWREKPGYRGTEALQIWPGYMKNDGWGKGTNLSGRVLYDRNGVTYASPYHSLEETTYTAAGFFGAYENTDITATFSIPARSESFRGYVFYDLEMIEEGWLLSSWCNYHRQAYPNYPIQTAADFSKSGFSIGRNDFDRRQSQLQLWWDEIEGPFEPND